MARRRWYLPCDDYAGNLCTGMGSDDTTCWTCGWDRFLHGTPSAALVDRADELAGSKYEAGPWPTSCLIEFTPSDHDRAVCRRCGHHVDFHLCRASGHRGHLRGECPDRDKRRIAASLAEG